jgi:hypothetical protein
MQADHILNLLLILLVIVFFPIISFADIIRIPNSYDTIQEGIDAATEGDTVLIARGTYIHDNLLVNKRLVIASNYIMNKDTTDIDSTIIKASLIAGQEWFLINADATGAKIIGLRIEGNNEHSLGITNTYTEVIHCKFIGGKDQLSLEGSSSLLVGGYIGYCYFEGAGDDGIDCDRTGNWIIEHNTIINSHQDGIEVRLHPKLSPQTSHIFRYNTIINPGESGIQLINYPGDSFRTFQIYGNIFKDCQGSGISCMYNTQTNEDYQGSDMEEKATIYNNTFDNCNYGLTEAPNLIILNNIIANCKNKGIARGAYVTMENDNSIVDYCNFYNNPTDYDSDISKGSNIFNFDPKFENATTYNLSSNSEAIDAGTANYLWQDLTVLSIPDSEYVGLAPDLGAKEYNGTHTGFGNNNIQPLKMMLYPNYPNPFNPKTTINYELPARSAGGQISNYVNLSIYNIIGEKVFTLVNQKQAAGMHQVEWDATSFASGVYYYQLRTDAGFIQTKKLVLLK